MNANYGLFPALAGREYRPGEVRDLAGDVARRVLVILALDVDFWPDRRDRANRVRRRVDGHPIDIFERGQHFRPQRFVEHRPARPFVDEAVGGNGHDEHVAEAARRLEMAHMAEVEEIEAAMRLHHRHPRLPVMIGDRSQLFDRSNLVTSILDPRRMEAAG